MALLWRVVVKWSGGQIGSGFSNLFYTEGVGTAQQAADATKTFFSAALTAGANLAPGVSLAFPSAVDVLEPGSGILMTALPITQPSPLNSSGSGTYAALAGSCVSWVTSGVVGGHRVKGRTFLVPLANSAFKADGTLSTVHMGDALTAANALIAAPSELVVWHRPGPLGVGGGSTHPVLAAKLSGKVAMLTSRR